MLLAVLANRVNEMPALERMFGACEA